MVDTLHILIKPASGNCNMRCSYCFYADEACSREIQSYGSMELDTAQVLIEKAIDYAGKRCTFTFQGGEPTLAGLSYYRAFTEIVKKNNKKKI